MLWGAVFRDVFNFLYFNFFLLFPLFKVVSEFNSFIDLLIQSLCFWNQVFEALYARLEVSFDPWDLKLFTFS